MSLHDLFAIEWTEDTKNSEDNYVAVGTLLDDYSKAEHVALIIKYNDEIYQFEFTGSTVKFESYQRNFLQKTTEVIEAADVPAFLQYCRNVERNASPRYGNFFSGTMYDKDGRFSGGPLAGERMTCVGFCLNVLNGFLEESQYLRYQDWNDGSVDDHVWLNNYCDRHNIDRDRLRKEYRRITPTELFTSAFFKELPVTKAQIDQLLPSITDYFRNHRRK